MELCKVGEKTYYIKNPTNIGIYKVDNENVWLIDSGNDKDAGKKILKIVEENGWKVAGIINTHSNADHIGGNKVIKDRTNCKILGYGIEKSFSENPILEPSFLYGGYPFKNLRNKTLLANGTEVENINNNLPEGLECINLKGHFFDMIGIKTSDDVYFLADSLFSEETIKKYHVFFIYDIKEYLNTLEQLKNLNGKLYIPSHCEATENIDYLIQLNKDKINEILNSIIEICEIEHTFEEILKEIFDKYNLTMNMNQYVLVGSTIKSYISYLVDENKITYIIENNRILWKNQGNAIEK